MSVSKEFQVVVYISDSQGRQQAAVLASSAWRMARVGSRWGAPMRMGGHTTHMGGRRLLVRAWLLSAS